MILLLALACGAPPTELSGRVVDALTGKALAPPSSGDPLQVKGAAVDEADAGCAEIAADLDAEGRFVLPAGCRGVRYLLLLSAADRRLDPVEVTGGEVGELELKAWPWSAEGVWQTGGSGLLAVASQATLREDRLVGGVTVRFPDVLPSELPLVGVDEWLLLSGAAHAGSSVVPLLPAGAVSFGDPAAPREIGPWSYLGMRIEGAGAEPVTATLAETSVVRHEIDGMPGAWIRGDALPAGIYAVEGPQRRLYVVRFGE